MQIIDRVRTCNLAPGDQIIVERVTQRIVRRTNRTRDRIGFVTVYDVERGRRGRWTICTSGGILYAHSVNEWNRTGVATHVPCPLCGRLNDRSARITICQGDDKATCHTPAFTRYLLDSPGAADNYADLVAAVSEAAPAALTDDEIVATIVERHHGFPRVADVATAYDEAKTANEDGAYWAATTYDRQLFRCSVEHDDCCGGDLSYILDHAREQADEFASANLTPAA